MQETNAHLAWTVNEWVTYLWHNPHRKLGIIDIPKHLMNRDLCMVLMQMDPIRFFPILANCTLTRDLITQEMVEEHVQIYPSSLASVPERFKTWSLCIRAWHARGACSGYGYKGFYSGFPAKYRIRCDAANCMEKHSVQLMTFHCGERHFVCDVNIDLRQQTHAHHKVTCGLSQEKKQTVLESQSTLPKELVEIISQLEGCSFSK